MLRFPNTLGVIFGAGMNIVSRGSPGVQRDSALLGAACGRACWQKSARQGVPAVEACSDGWRFLVW